MRDGGHVRGNALMNAAAGAGAPDSGFANLPLLSCRIPCKIGARCHAADLPIRSHARQGSSALDALLCIFPCGLMFQLPRAAYCAS